MNKQKINERFDLCAHANEIHIEQDKENCTAYVKKITSATEYTTTIIKTQSQNCLMLVLKPIIARMLS